MGWKMWYYNLMNSANPPRSRTKNLSHNEKLNDSTNKNRLCRRLADTRDLKSLSENRVQAQPLSTTYEKLRTICYFEWFWAFFVFRELWRDEEKSFAKKVEISLVHNWNLWNNSAYRRENEAVLLLTVQQPLHEAAAPGVPAPCKARSSRAWADIRSESRLRAAL